MSTQTIPSAISWTDAAAQGTRVERTLIAVARTLMRLAAESARARAERAPIADGYAEEQWERMWVDAARRGVIRR